MPMILKWLFRAAGGLVALALVAGLVGYVLLSRSLPDYDKRMAVEGISAPVEIVRDTANVPHVFGESDADTFFGLGYAHAQDRLWQMMTMRRTVQGRLSEVFGARTVSIDTTMRRFDLYNLARRSVAAQDAATLTALKAYSDGVNARLTEINREALGRGAPEQFLFDAPVAPWQPADSIALVKLMAVRLSGHLSEEVLRARTSLALDAPERVEDILPRRSRQAASRRCRTTRASFPVRISRPPPRARATRPAPRSRPFRCARLPARRTPGPQHQSGRRRGARCWPMTRISASRRRGSGISPGSNCRAAG